MKIYKYQISGEGNDCLQLPDGYRILSAGEQDGQIFIWAIVNPDAPLMDARFRIYATGFDDIPAFLNNGYLQYIDTVLMKSGLVWHIFQEIDCERGDKLEI